MVRQRRISWEMYEFMVVRRERRGDRGGARDELNPYLSSVTKYTTSKGESAAYCTHLHPTTW
jgi:hypothetical protein